MKLAFAKTLAAATLAVLFTSSVQALQITVENAGVTTTSVSGANVENFDNGTCGTYASCNDDFLIVSGSVGGEYAQPANTTSRYLSVPNPKRSGTASLILGTTANYFGLYWGSIDTYNTLTFLRGTMEVASFTGSAIAAEIPGLADGNQTAPASNRYFNFFFGSELFDQVQLSSTNFAFETDNHAFATVSEPGTVALLALGLTGLVVSRRRKQA